MHLDIDVHVLRIHGMSYIDDPIDGNLLLNVQGDKDILFPERLQLGVLRCFLTWPVPKMGFSEREADTTPDLARSQDGLF
jgi:hypothetical protein